MPLLSLILRREATRPSAREKLCILTASSFLLIQLKAKTQLRNLQAEG